MWRGPPRAGRAQRQAPRGSWSACDHAAVSANDLVAELAKAQPRAAGSDAERRAARRLARELTQHGRAARLETFWCRPNRALSHAWHVALGLAGSLLMVSEPAIGGALLLLALVSLLADELTGLSLGRRLTPERASQNVVSESAAERPVRLILTADYDAGRCGLVWHRRPRSMARRAGALGRHRGPGWAGWLALSLVWLLVIAALRLGGAGSGSVGILQLIPTVGLVLALAALLELAGAAPGPAANDNASGVAVALAITRALDAAPPARLAVDVVLCGAADGGGIGLRAHLRRRRRALKPANTIVLGIAACGAGKPVWWVSDGPLVPLRYHPRLRSLVAGLAAAEPALGLGAHRGRGATPALPARFAGLPALSVGRVDRAGLAPRSHTAQDTSQGLDPRALDATVQIVLMLIDAIDADLARPGAPSPAAVPAAA
jgi:Peptidase family M28